MHFNEVCWYNYYFVLLGAILTWKKCDQTWIIDCHLLTLSNGAAVDVSWPYRYE